MKIATFNVNDVKKRQLANLLGWLRQAGPDVACLQELKIAAIKKAGYRGGGITVALKMLSHFF